MNNKEFLEHTNNPLNMGEIENLSAIGSVLNKDTLDQVIVHLLISENGIIEDAKFKADGVDELKGAGSVITATLKGKSIDFAITFKGENIAKEIENLDADKIYCFQIFEQATKKAIGDYYTKRGIFEEEKSNCKCCSGNCEK